MRMSTGRAGTAAQGVMASLGLSKLHLGVSLCPCSGWPCPAGVSICTIPRGSSPPQECSGVLCCLGRWGGPGKSTQVTLCSLSSDRSHTVTEFLDVPHFQAFIGEDNPHLPPLQEPSHHFHLPPSLPSFPDIQDFPPLTLEMSPDFPPLWELLAPNNYSNMCTERADLQLINKP